MKTIVKVIAEHSANYGADCPCGSWTYGSGTTHAQHVAEAIREERTVRTVEELDALPVTALIRNQGDMVAEKQHDGTWWEFNPPGAPVGFPASAIVGPLAGHAVVLWTPEDEQ